MVLPPRICAREAVLRGLDPGGSEAGEPVLPTAEPDPDDVHVILTGALNELIDQAEIVLPLLGLDPVPRYAGQDGVHVDFAGEQRPDRFHALRVGGYGIAQFTAQQEERPAIDYQLRGLTTFFQMRNCAHRGLSLCARHRSQGA